ncbi:hypothetical protein Tco_1114440 [Tanacetum coccineum]|uniref:Uncharacterized protein n=1 Tax=Tanacetum coccineum TaxID=301880 RepID=A0ABQ5IV40_9ASTR
MPLTLPNSCHIEATLYPSCAVLITVVVEVVTADYTGHHYGGALPRWVWCSDVCLNGDKYLLWNNVNTQPCTRTLPGTYPSDMTAYTPTALSPLSVSPSYPSYHTNPT